MAALREVANPSELFLVRARPRLARHRGLRRHRGHAAAAGRNPGAGRAVLARHAAARGRRLGSEPPVDGARRAGSPLRRASSAATTSISMSRAACASASRPPISPPPPRWCLRSPMRRCRPTRSISGRYLCSRARCGRWPKPQRGSKEAAKLGLTRAVVPEAARSRRNHGPKASRVGSLSPWWPISPTCGSREQPLKPVERRVTAP